MLVDRLTLLVLYFCNCRVVYCILGACDVTDEHSEIIKTADDYLWLKLCQVRDHEATSDSMTYSLLQTLVLEEYGT